MNYEDVFFSYRMTKYYLRKICICHNNFGEEFNY